MLQEHDDRLRIIRARTILDMLGERPATGRNLFRPLKGLDNAALLVRGGRVLDVLPWKSVRVPAGTPVTDMGDVTLMPAYGGPDVVRRGLHGLAAQPHRPLARRA